LTEQKHALIYGIYFKFARADIRPVSEPVLKEIAAVLKSNPGWTLSIVGHTDGVGNAAANLDLSRRRATSVKTALVERYGIDANRLTTGGFGASDPQASNDTPEGRARNRRVELTRQ
jgi:outer membrane protein OmpA-like peptidoglycan-associated protein